MNFVQFSTLPLPAAEDVDRSVVFPCFATEETAVGSEVLRYRLAMLVSDRNHLVRALLLRLGFSEDDSTVPDGEGLDDSWSFFVCGDDGPIAQLSEEVGAEHPFSTYFSALEFEDGSDFRPSRIAVANSTLNAREFNRSFNGRAPWFAGLPMLFDDAESKLSWADSDGVETPILSFRLTAQRSVPQVSGGSLEVEMRVSFHPAADSGTWGGGLLRLNAVEGETDSGVVVVGNPGDRLVTEAGILTSRFSGLGAAALAYDILPTTALQLPIGGSGLIAAEVAVQAIAIRFDQAPVGLYLYPGAGGGAVPLTVRLTFPLIMAPLAQATDALSLIIPLVDIDNEKPKLDYAFTFQIGDGWEFESNPIFELDGARWKFNNQFFTDNEWNALVRNRGGKGFSLGGLTLSLADLLGDALGPVNFSLVPSTIKRFRTTIVDGAVDLPIGFQVRIGGQVLALELNLQIDLRSCRLSANRLNFRFPESINGEAAQIIDLIAFAIIIPTRKPGVPSRGYDGTIDFSKREFRLSKPTDPEDNVAAPWVVLPGGLTEDFSNRLIFQLQPDFRPDVWPSEVGEGEACYFRINGNGASFHAKIVTSHNATVFPGDESRSALDVRPHEERSAQSSQIVVIDNAIRQAVIFGEMDVPGFDDLIANVEVGLRQETKGAPPIIYAAVDLDTTDGSPLAQMTAGYLQVSLDDFRARLTWDTGNHDWDLAVIIDGTASLSPKVGSTGGLDDLKKRDAIIVRDLNLMELHKGAGSIALQLERPVGFSCLDGMFAVSLYQLQFSWGGTFVLACETAAFTFMNPGAFDVTIEVGGVHLEFSGGNKLKMRNPSRIGIDAVIGDSVRFRGAVAWVDNDRERYFAAAGTLGIEGLPEASTLLKIGIGRKQNGQIVPNIVLYGAIDQEITLFSGVVAKSFGAGIGINNRLAGIGERPNA
ncbi:MAG: hypothetical protein KDB00_01580, partial [Planctomycetales bacterium]|nr:hypothetical protein [Planctomycetales bacterium]